MFASFKIAPLVFAKHGVTIGTYIVFVFILVGLKSCHSVPQLCHIVSVNQSQLVFMSLEPIGMLLCVNFIFYYAAISF